MANVADPLREYLAAHAPGDDGVWMLGDRVIGELAEIADAIDREHCRRMDQQSHELLRAHMKYIASVVEDYKHGIKRKERVRNDG